MRSWRLDISRLIAALVLIATLTMAVRVPTSPDMWWHLRCGEVQWQTRSILRADIFSHTAAGRPWINQSWLPQVAMYGLYALGGFGALALAVAAMVTLTFGLLLVDMHAESRYAHFARAAVLLWAAISSGPLWAARPHLVTLAMTAAWVYILDQRQIWRQRSRLLWLLPLLMLLWANSHGGYIMGFVLLAAEAGGEIVDAIWRRRFENLGAQLGPAAGVALLCLLAALLNPQGMRLLLFPFQTLTSSAQQGVIAEWASPDFHSADLLPFLLLLLATWSAMFLSGRPVTGVEWLRMLGFTAMALRSSRYVGLCAVVAAPILFRHGLSAWRRLNLNWGRRPSLIPPARGNLALNWVLLVLIVIAAAVKIAVPLNPQVIDQVHEGLYPVQAAAFMRQQALPRELFNDYGWGGYLIWALWPDLTVFIDGRADPYGDPLIMAYRQAIAAAPEWAQILDTYDVRSALIQSNSALAAAMRASGGWQAVYEDDQAVLLVQTEP